MMDMEKFWQDAEEFNLATGIVACAEIILAGLTPIVERAEEAVRLFFESELDVLFVGDAEITKA